jgi:2-keto-4-pentenoate hydratase/2-oxohepta-3-ene-1,7-dioic acid hydratase in catechol pathway
MRLASYRATAGLRAGVVVPAGVVDAAQAAAAVGLDGGRDWSSARAVIAAAADERLRLVEGAHGLAENGEGRVVATELAELGPPIPDPDKIICLGLNYSDHAAESGLEAPAAPMVFAKYRNSLAGPNDSIALPLVAGQVDYEAELAVVIGSRAKHVDPELALEAVAGVMAFNDLTARDLQHQTSQWTVGKAIDGFAPCGPVLVSLDELDDIQSLRLATRVNGEVVQDGTTADMIFSVAETIAFLSRTLTLEPGDVIATGTPAGVGISRTPPLLLGAGDLVEVELDGVGVLANRLVSATARPDGHEAGAMPERH